MIKVLWLDKVRGQYPQGGVIKNKGTIVYGYGRFGRNAAGLSWRLRHLGAPWHMKKSMPALPGALTAPAVKRDIRFALKSGVSIQAVIYKALCIIHIHFPSPNIMYTVCGASHSQAVLPPRGRPRGQNGPPPPLRKAQPRHAGVLSRPIRLSALPADL